MWLTVYPPCDRASVRTPHRGFTFAKTNELMSFDVLFFLLQKSFVLNWDDSESFSQSGRLGFLSTFQIKSSGALVVFYVPEQTGPGLTDVPQTSWLFGSSGSSCSTQKQWWRTPPRAGSCSKFQPQIQMSEQTERSHTPSTVQTQTSSTWTTGQVKHCLVVEPSRLFKVSFLSSSLLKAVLRFPSWTELTSSP